MTGDSGRASDADPFVEYRRLEFMESRIPIQDALAVFVPDDPPIDAKVKAAISTHAVSRWFPKPGGHEVLVPYAGEPYDASIFRVAPRAWDHVRMGEDVVVQGPRLRSRVVLSGTDCKRISGL
jgi:hypothetical protein